MGLFQSIVNKFQLYRFVIELSLPASPSDITRRVQLCEEALSLVRREDNPQGWAWLQNELGINLLENSLGDRAENLERAIQAFKSALTVRTYETFPQYWANTQINLGIAYRNRIRGEQTENLEQAIQAYEAALTVYTCETFPEEWAKVQHNLGFTYVERIEGETAENLERAIECYEAALSIRTRQAFPRQWADTQYSLGNAYRRRIRGDWAENWEQAIQCYEAALTVHTREAFPEEWADIQDGLGLAYTNRIRGEKAENLERAIQAFEAHLTVHTRESFPEKWADTMGNLGAVYVERICGEKAENLEQAIQAFEAALTVRTREAFPRLWAGTQSDLGMAYLDRIRGDRADNLEQAIHYYKAALTVSTSAKFPQSWAVLNNNLGIAYIYRIRGDKAENLEQAIQVLELSLTIYTREAFPQQWARGQNNIGLVYLSFAYYSSNQEDRAENLEQAIQAFEAALTVFTREAFPERWATIQNNLGMVYTEREKGNRSENLERAIEYYFNALQIRTLNAFPADWAGTQNNIGTVYDAQGQIPAAIQAFQCALEVYTSTTFPLTCFGTGSNLGNTAFSAGLWSAAIQGYGAAIEAVETSRTWAISEKRRQEIQAEAIGVYQKIVQACVSNGQLDLAIEYVERSRSKRLVDLMASNDLYQGGEIPAEIQHYLQQYDTLQQRIDEEQSRYQSERDPKLGEIKDKSYSRAAIEASTESIRALEAQKQQVWEQLRSLDEVFASQIQVTPLKLTVIQQLIDRPSTAILSFYSTSSDTYVFVLKQNQITCHTCVGQGWETLQSWIASNWLQPYVETKTEWRSQISTILSELARRLQFDELISQHLGGIKELILVPHLLLHQIPFAALPIAATDSSSYLGDRFLIRYVPSCQILKFCHERSPLEETLTWAIVEDATEDLLFARFECERIVQLYNIPENQRLKGRSQATVENYRQLVQQKKIHRLHSSHHAICRLDEPLASKLELANGSLTLGQLLTLGWRLPHLIEVFLSCCETNLGMPSLTDDILTLAAGFLCAGARSVVSTLWTVDELATALFCIFYYQQRQQERDRLEAIQQAQTQLRTLKGSDCLAQLQEELEREFQQAEAARKVAKARQDEVEVRKYAKAANWFRNMRKQLNGEERTLFFQQEYPFANPYYWASFTCQGLR